MHFLDRDIALTSAGSGLWAGQVTDDWSVNDTANGGYVLAMMAAAMCRHTPRRQTPIVTANYLRRCASGPAAIAVETLAQSTRLTRLQARLIQNGQENVRAWGTFAEDNGTGMAERLEAGPPEVAAPEQCVAIPEMPRYTIFRHLEVRLDPSCTGWMTDGRLVQRSEQKGWIRFRQDRPHDLFSVILAADAFPPAVLASQGMVAWVPTIELTVNVRRIPDTRWVQGVFRTRFITCGQVEEDGELWDGNGRLVAISRQIAQFRRDP
jgi:acyl-CoA thioesterase